MDFSKLTEDELTDFLSRPYGISPNLSSSKIEQAEYLYNQIKDSSVGLPLPIIDLLLATEYTGPVDRTYRYSDILNLTGEEVNLFAQIFGFNPEGLDLKTNRLRILRILRFLGLIVDESKIITSDPILEILCKTLNLADLNNFRLANNLEYLNCEIPVSDPNNQIKTVNGLNSQNYHLVENIQNLGSNKSLNNYVRSNDIESAKFLLDNGVDPDNESGRLPAIVIASGQGNFEMVELLLKYNVNEYNRHHALMSASEKGHKMIIEILLKSGVDVNQENDFYLQKSAIVHASFHNQVDVVELLLKYGADPDKRGVDSSTSLIIASEEGYIGVAALLLVNGASIDLKNRSGKTALMRASETNHINVVKLLIKYGANINERDNNGLTALRVADIKKYYDIVTLLESHGAK